MGDTERLPDDRLAALREDPEARFEFLVERNVLVELDDGSVTATREFESHRGIYVDSYRDAPDEEFHETVADLFDLSVEEAADRVEELDLSRWEVATYLTLQSHLDVSVPGDVLLELAAMTASAGTASPVPVDMDELGDDDWAPFIETNGDAVLFVFQHGCDPCEAMKHEMPANREAAPEGVVFAGLDGEEVPEFRREYEVTVAPTTLVFADGELAERKEGYCAPEDMADLFAEAYPAADH